MLKVGYIRGVKNRLWNVLFRLWKRYYYLSDSKNKRRVSRVFYWLNEYFVWWLNCRLQFFYSTLLNIELFCRMDWVLCGESGRTENDTGTYLFYLLYYTYLLYSTYSTYSTYCTVPILPTLLYLFYLFYLLYCTYSTYCILPILPILPAALYRYVYKYIHWHRMYMFDYCVYLCWLVILTI